MTRKNLKIYYPLLLGIYSSIALVSTNISQMIFLAGLRAILISIIFSFSCYAFCFWRIKNEHKAALICALFFLFFYSYGFVYDAIEGVKILDFEVGRHRFLFPFYLILLGMVLWAVDRRVKPTPSISRLLNITCIILVAIPIFQIGLFEWQRERPFSGRLDPASSDTLNSDIRADYPDIYYIILDGYARDDILLQNYGLDISGYIDRLEELGFYVPRCSQSNYGMTALSLASSLNMNFLDQILPQAIESGDNILAFSDSIKHNLVRQRLEEQGYETVSFQNDIWWTEWSDADHFITLENKPSDLVIDFQQISNFEVMYIRTTLLRLVEELGTKWIDVLFPSVKSPQEHQAELILLALDNLEKIPEMQGPKFVFAHIIAPHEPYVFSPDGDFIVTEAADPGYPNQIQYMNKRMIQIVTKIISESRIPPVIILQADHGRDPEFRLANFMAIYLPGIQTESLYPTLTPVNLFRLVLPLYFGDNLPLLPDTSYFSFYDDTYTFSEISYPCDYGR